MRRVRKLKEDNKCLEGKIDEQKKTKKFLKELFLQQTTNKMEQPTQQVRDHPSPVLIWKYDVQFEKVPIFDADEIRVSYDVITKVTTLLDDTV